MPESTRFSTRDWLIVPAALALALLWREVFSLGSLVELAAGLGGPALGIGVFTAAIWAAVLLFLGRGAHWNPFNAGLAAGTGALAAACCIYGNAEVRAVNCLLILGASALAFFSLAGVSARPLTDSRSVPEAVALSFRALFSCWSKPFRALAALRRGGKGQLGGVLVGLVCTLPVLLLCGALLASADSVFNSLFGALADWLFELDALNTAFRVLDTLFFTLCFFSAIYFVLHADPREAAARDAEASVLPSPVPYITALVLLCALYALFVGIQFEYLFGGSEAAAMEGGWAEYARSGFSQLVLVTAVNLCALLFCSAMAGHSRAVRALCLLLAALTAVILFSAFWRMRLYVLAYGLSVRRAMTLWAMAFILCCLILACIKALRPGFRFWPWFAAIGLAGWAAFNFANVDARVAEWNVDSYLSGALEEVDVDYLSSLSPDVIPALERLYEAEPRPDLGAELDILRGRSPSSWTEWSLCYVRH